jgi:hypothetical protein
MRRQAELLKIFLAKQKGMWYNFSAIVGSRGKYYTRSAIDGQVPTLCAVTR